MYKCPTCGSGLVFEPKTQMLKCQSCGNSYDPEQLDKLKLSNAKEIKNVEEESNENEYEAVSYKCSNCGAELITTNETITTFCSYCRTGTMLDRKIVKKRKPDYIIPFSKTEEECKEIYINKIKKAGFAPKDMIDTQEVEKIRGIYMPYWIYSFEKHGDVVAKGSRYSHREGDYECYDDFTLRTKIDAKCSGLTHDATSNFSDRLSEAVIPYSTKDKKVFSPAYLSGFYADSEDVDNEIYENDNSKYASKYISNELYKAKEFHKYNAKPNVSMDTEKVELGLFPVYFLATKNKKGDRISYAVINGQTGKIAADIPIDFKKFALFSFLIALPIFIILNLFLTISMSGLIVWSIIFNIISLIILFSQNIRINKVENNLDDKGSIYKKSQENNGQSGKKKSKKLFRGVLKLLLGLVITILIFIFNPASDLYYYIAALISIAMSILSFINIITKYNILTTRKLPQLEKRGGDENA